ncbi:hypothetical protein [Bifidobacterium miconisargentati]|uniref:hypothetical protein n=1 Tax=Bifidobacterium miconisargentati TaxID=2834437 RepID=UPI001BDD34EF|nr:hypothetical protein [Bifidobacterium miconisargentati]MBW3090029.1 hypothetical protein [Bifidobacterium miconisargentati]
MSDSRGFDSGQVAYLNGLPAVARADSRRIVYADWFRDEVMRRYGEGVPPTAVFREAGLGPEIIGGKRIERCVARWRRETGTAPMRRGRPPVSADRNKKAEIAASQLATIAELERGVVALGERLGLDPMGIDADRRQVVIDGLSRLVEDYRQRLGERIPE